MADSRREDSSRRHFTSWNRGTTLGFAALLIRNSRVPSG